MCTAVRRHLRAECRKASGLKRDVQAFACVPAAMRQACCAGMAALEAGADRMEAVTAAIAVLEASMVQTFPART